MRMRRRLTAWLTAAALSLAAMGTAAYAAEVPDLSATGTISLTMMYGEKVVKGGRISLYRVGDILEDDGNYSFVLTEDFAGSGASLADVTSTETAEALKTYITENKLTGLGSSQSLSTGTATWTDLPVGLYLLVQTTRASGYKLASPFLVSLPMYEDGVYVYTVEAAPKVELEKGTSGGGGGGGGGSSSGGGGGSSSSSGGPGSSSGSSGSDSGSPASSSDADTGVGDRLPQTGQLNWPVPVLVVFGLALISAGWILRFGRKDHEK